MVYEKTFKPLEKCPPEYLHGKAPCIYIDYQILGETPLAFIFSSSEKMLSTTDELECLGFFDFEAIVESVEHDFRSFYIDPRAVEIPVDESENPDIIIAIVDKRFAGSIDVLSDFVKEFLLPAFQHTTGGEEE